MECLYQVVESKFPLSDHPQSEYGIAATVMQDGCVVVLASVHHICPDLSAITQLAQICNQLKLDPAHLPDIVNDFLAQR